MLLMYVCQCCNAISTVYRATLTGRTAPHTKSSSDPNGAHDLCVDMFLLLLVVVALLLLLLLSHASSFGIWILLIFQCHKRSSADLRRGNLMLVAPWRCDVRLLWGYCEAIVELLWGYGEAIVRLLWSYCWSCSESNMKLLWSYCERGNHLRSPRRNPSIAGYATKHARERGNHLSCL